MVALPLIVILFGEALAWAIAVWLSYPSSPAVLRATYPGIAVQLSPWVNFTLDPAYLLAGLLVPLLLGLACNTRYQRLALYLSWLFKGMYRATFFVFLACLLRVQDTWGLIYGFALLYMAGFSSFVAITTILQALALPSWVSWAYSAVWWSCLAGIGVALFPWPGVLILYVSLLIQTGLLTLGTRSPLEHSQEHRGTLDTACLWYLRAESVLPSLVYLPRFKA